jgi:D-alanyl-D-alanine carboxypeptidase
VVFRTHKASSPSVSGKNSTQNSQSSNNSNSFDKKKYSNDDPTSIWVVVNKPRPLSPIDYEPASLVVPGGPLRVPGNESMQVRPETAKALDVMFADAKAAGLNLMLSSGYRSYTYQVGLYGGYVKSMGQAAADTQSARPGHSEHQTGFAADIEPASKKCELDACFGDTPEGKWLVANAYKYGFIIRYPADKVAVTGYAYHGTSVTSVPTYQVRCTKLALQP